MSGTKSQKHESNELGAVNPYPDETNQTESNTTPAGNHEPEIHDDLHSLVDRQIR